MNKISVLLKVFFHIFNMMLIFFYLYPGSLFGYFLYGDIKKQPEITSDFLNISSNHFFVFVLLSILGILAYFRDKNISLVIRYLFLLSITLELFHIILPARAFQYEDLFGNILGTSLILIFYKILK